MMVINLVLGDLFKGALSSPSFVTGGPSRRSSILALRARAPHGMGSITVETTMLQPTDMTYERYPRRGTTNSRDEYPARANGEEPLRRW